MIEGHEEVIYNMQKWQESEMDVICEREIGQQERQPHERQQTERDAFVLFCFFKEKNETRD